ncbi:DUF397 domain-containing protein [Streptomonospora sediminis]
MNSGECIEVSGWRKSSYSDVNAAACVEVAGWRKSSHSGNGPSCVEIADSPRHIHIRDTQHRELGHLTFPTSSWHTFISTLKTEEF